MAYKYPKGLECKKGVTLIAFAHTFKYKYYLQGYI